jgi:hypothetical protein
VAEVARSGGDSLSDNADETDEYFVGANGRVYSVTGWCTDADGRSYDVEQWVHTHLGIPFSSRGYPFSDSFFHGSICSVRRLARRLALRHIAEVRQRMESYLVHR